MTEWLGLRNKVVVITGAAGGMGTKFSHDFAEQGAKLVLMDIAEERVEKLSKELADEFKVDEAVKKVVDKFGRVDVLVNTAAILRFSPLEDLTFDEWKQQINININGYFLTSQRFGRQMIKQKKGTMVHISTVASHFPETYSGAYSTTKAAVNMISKQIAAEWGQFGVRSNCVLPCLVKTPLSKDFYKDKEVEDGRSRLVASKRIGELKDISNTVLFLASDRSGYTNGDEINVDGGIGIMMQDMIPKPGGRRQYAIDHHKK